MAGDYRAQIAAEESEESPGTSSSLPGSQLSPPPPALCKLVYHAVILLYDDLSASSSPPLAAVEVGPGDHLGGRPLLRLMLGLIVNPTLHQPQTQSAEGLTLQLPAGNIMQRPKGKDSNMKIAHLLSILGLLTLGAHAAAADPDGNHDNFTGTYFTSPTPPAAEILQIHSDGTAILTTSDQVTVGAGGLTFSDSIGSWRALGGRKLSARFLNLNFAGTIPAATYAGAAVVDYIYQFSTNFNTITVTCDGKI